MSFLDGPWLTSFHRAPFVTVQLFRGLHSLHDLRCGGILPVVLVAAAVVDEDPLEVGDGEEVLFSRVAALLSLLRRVERAAKR